MARTPGQDDDQDPVRPDGDAGELDAASEAELTRQAAAALPGGVAPTEAVARPSRGIARFPAFLRASWAELQRVQWPDRRQVTQATAVVLGFVVVAGGFLGLADAAASRFVDLIL